MSYVKFSLGDHEPADNTEFNAFEPLFPGLIVHENVDNRIVVSRYVHELGNLKYPVLAQGRRFAVQYFNAHTISPVELKLVFIISSIPSEVPDCLLSANHKSL